MFEILSDIAQKKYDRIILMVGPEGDLTAEEKKELQAKGFRFTRLTPTVLRAQDAVAVGLGSIRSIVHFSK